MVSEKNRKKTILLGTIVPLACCIIFAVLCMINLRGSIWFDESYSAYLIRGDFSDIWRLTSADVHPPFFYFCLKIWSLIFGTSDVSLRFMSIFFGALTIIFLFQLLKRWFGLKAASVASFFLAISPMFIRYGQEMRMYTLVFFIIVLATYILDLALETNKTRYYIGYAILVALGMWTHYFTAFAWLAHIVFLIIAQCNNSRHKSLTNKSTIYKSVWNKKLIATYVLAVLLFLPWIPSFIAQVSSVQKEGFWVDPVSVVSPLDFFSKAVSFTPAVSALNWLMPLLLLILVLFIILVARTFKILQKKEKARFLLILLLVIVPPLALMLLSMPPLESMFVDRYVVYSSALVWVVIGLVIVFATTKPATISSNAKPAAIPSNTKSTTTPSNTRPAITFAILLAISSITASIIGIINVEKGETEDYEYSAGLIKSIQSISDRNEPILAGNEWIYYDAVFYDNEKNPVYGADAWIDYKYGSIYPIRDYRYHLINNLDEFLDNHQKLWYVTYKNEDAKTLADYTLPPELSSDYRIVTDIIVDDFAAFELEKTPIE